MQLRVSDSCENQSTLFTLRVSWIEHSIVEDETIVGFACEGTPIATPWNPRRGSDRVVFVLPPKTAA